MAEFQEVETAIKAINPRADCIRTSDAAVELAWVERRRGFDAAALEESLERMPSSDSSATLKPKPVLDFGTPPVTGSRSTGL